jgi:hypothetical protein
VCGLNPTPVIVELLEVVHQLLVLRAIRVHGSWLNQAQIEINLFSGNALANEEFLPSRCCGGKLTPGIAG